MKEHTIRIEVPHPIVAEKLAAFAPSGVTVNYDKGDGMERRGGAMETIVTSVTISFTTTMLVNRVVPFLHKHLKDLGSRAAVFIGERKVSVDSLDELEAAFNADFDRINDED